MCDLVLLLTISTKALPGGAMHPLAYVRAGMDQMTSVHATSKRGKGWGNTYFRYFSISETPLND